MNGHYAVGDVVLGDWELSRELGSGSFGKVYEAIRHDFGITYRAAIKIITIPQSKDELREVRAEAPDEHSVSTYFHGVVEEVIQELALMSQLKGNSNIVSYEDHKVVAHTDDVGWDILIRMELLTPMLDHIHSHKPTRNEIINIGVDICKALELCQRFDIIHRDIKPENIFVSDFGCYKLGDFGIARSIERTSGVLSKKGTYTYMAPEVYKEQSYGANADIYSLGIVMYRLLNDNRAPFLPEFPNPIKHSDRECALMRRLSGESLPAPKNADMKLSEIVLKACEFHPNTRYSVPKQMREDLETLLYQQESTLTVDINENVEDGEVDSDRNEIIEPEKTTSVFDTSNHNAFNAQILGDKNDDQESSLISDADAAMKDELHEDNNSNTQNETFYENTNLSETYVSESGIYELLLNEDGSCVWYQSGDLFYGVYKITNAGMEIQILGNYGYENTCFSATRDNGGLIIRGGKVDELFSKADGSRITDVMRYQKSLDRFFKDSATYSY